jgi:hypothetical protein
MRPSRVIPRYEGVSSSLSALPFRTSLATCLLVDSVKTLYVVLPSFILSSHFLDQLSRLFSAICTEKLAIERGFYLLVDVPPPFNRTQNRDHSQAVSYLVSRPK